MMTTAAFALLLAAPAAFAQTAASPDEIRPLLVGQSVPGVRVRNLKGEDRDLAELMRGHHTVLVFYRGGWCPYCNTQLSALGDAKARLAKLGWEIVAVSPDRPAELNKSKGKHKLDYSLLSDSGMAAARRCGLAFKVDAKTLKKYRGYGIDLKAASGETHHELPVPAVFLVGPDGKVRFQYVNPDYKIRLDPRVLIAAAEAYRD